MSEIENELRQESKQDVVWIASCAAITILAVFLRFFWLGLKPFHHDEGVNGWFLTNLFREGVYKYDPANYHGPTLYYITLGFVEVFGLETVPVRWSVAVWGVLMVVLAFYLRPYIGWFGSLFAGLFLAISPGMVFISRYFIHEIFFVFLGLGFVLAVLLFMDKERAGPGAIFWMALLLFVCFLPPIMRLAPAMAGDSASALWAIRIGLFAAEGVLIFFVIRMLREWNGGRSIYLLLAAGCVALMLATKETTFITLATMLIACVCIWARELIAKAAAERRFPGAIAAAAVAASALLAILIAAKLPDVAADFGRRVHGSVGGPSAESLATLFYLIVVLVPATLVVLIYRSDRRRGDGLAPSEFDQPSLAAFRSAVGTRTDSMLLAASTAAIIIYLIVLFFSSFFTYGDGVRGFYEAYEVWLKTGSKDHTQNGIWAYIEWGMASDGPIMLLSLAGFAIALIRGRDRFALFAGLWAFGLFAAYTIIPYKTPWLALSFLLPMCIAAGYAINALLASKRTAIKVAGLIVAVAAAAVLSYQTYILNFVRYDDEDAPMVYAHTQREFLDMVRDIEHFAEASGKGKDAAIDIVSPDYWPLVWYMRDFPKAVFHGRLADSSTPPEMIVAKKGEQDRDVARKYLANYEIHGTYKLRSGVDLVLLVRKDLSGRRGMDKTKNL